MLLYYADMRVSAVQASQQPRQRINASLELYEDVQCVLAVAPYEGQLLGLVGRPAETSRRRCRNYLASTSSEDPAPSIALGLAASPPGAGLCQACSAVSPRDGLPAVFGAHPCASAALC